ncbi:MAG: glycosyltransferase, partial [Planctomycetota bacterium]
MRIAMFTNTYLPHVGGVAQSVDRFTRGYRQRGHRVLVVAPRFEGQPEAEEDVVRLPAIQNFNGSDFSVVLPASDELRRAIEAFEPEIIHSHHPFLIGNTALRQAARYGVPLVYTLHTMYEHYTHYVPLGRDAMKRYVVELVTGYANLCDGVIAPSESVEAILHDRGVTTPIAVVPTGVDTETFGSGDGRAARQRLDMPSGAFLIGHVGRLAPEKNLVFLAQALAHTLE